MSEEIALQLRLDTGDAVANANQFTRAMESMTTAMSKAAIAGDTKGVMNYADSMMKFKKAVGLNDEDEDQRKPKAMRIVEGVTKIISKAPNYIGAMGGGNPAGAALGMAGDAAKAGEMAAGAGASTAALAAAGVGVALVGLGAGANKLSEQWERMAPAAMALTATLGNLAGEAKSNSAAFLEAFNSAGTAAAKFGYSLEEGMAAATELGKIGAYKRNDHSVFESEERVFAYQRGTNVDRSTLLQTEGYANRYGLEKNAIGLAYGGTLASGMEAGQFQEYLNATLRIFEDGLSRGVVKGFGEVTRTQNFIAALGGDNQLWKGEQGLQRYQKLNSSLENSTSLQSEYDVISYQAMRATMDQARLHGFKDDKEGAWSQYAKYDTDFIDPRNGKKIDYGYLDTFRAHEGGFTPEFFTNYMSLVEKQIAGGDPTAAVESIKRSFGMSNTDSIKLFEAFAKGDYKGAKDVYEKAPKGDSPEQRLFSLQQLIKQDIVNIGADITPLKEGVLRGLNTVTAVLAGDRMAKNADTAIGGVLGQSGEASLSGSFSGLLREAIRSGTTGQAGAAYSILDQFQSMDPRKKAFIDSTNALNPVISKQSLDSLASFDKFLSGLFESSPIKTSYENYSAMVDRQDDKGAGAAFAAAVPKSYREPEVGYGFGGKKQVRPGGTFHTELSAEAASGSEWAKLLQNSIWNFGDPNGIFASVGGSKALKTASDMMSAARKPSSPGGAIITEEEGMKVFLGTMRDIAIIFSQAAEKQLKASELAGTLEILYDDQSGRRGRK